MAIDRTKWKGPWRKEQFPLWLCPWCHEGNLVLQTDTINEVEEAGSAQVHGEDWWDPEMLQGRFVCFLKCTNPRCREMVTCTGTSGLTDDSDPYGEDHRYVGIYKPLFMHPAPVLFKVPKDCPDTVTAEVINASSLIWSDPVSSVSRIRTSLERLMDSLRVNKTVRDAKTGQKKWASLDSRIRSYEAGKADIDLRSLLSAIRKVSNKAVHGSTISSEEVFVCFELLELVLDRIYNKKAKHLIKLSHTINKRKSFPRSPKP